MKIWAHTLVRNEERYIWFSIMSVIEYLDKILVWDTGSHDNTLSIIGEIKKRFPEKIDFRKLSKVDPYEFTKVRQEMLDATKADWFILVDGDEVWWEDSIKKVVNKIKTAGDNLESIVVPFYSSVGDIYHYQDESAGGYAIDGRVGHLTIRAMNRKIPGLHVQNPYGKEGYFDSKGIEIQKRASNHRKFLRAPYLHFSHLVRSSKDEKVMQRSKKLKYELDKSFPLDFFYPEVLFRKRPDIVPSPWKSADKLFRAKSSVINPLRRLKRKWIR